MGSKTAITRSADLFKSSRIQNSNKLKSIKLSRFATPIRSQKLRIDAGVKPRLRKPEIVGMRGSSQPFTTFSFTNCNSFRLLITVWDKFKRANSYWWDGKIPNLSKNQSYKGRWTSNSKVQMEWVISSMESLWPCAKSYIG